MRERTSTKVPKPKAFTAQKKIRGSTPSYREECLARSELQHKTATLMPLSNPAPMFQWVRSYRSQFPSSSPLLSNWLEIYDDVSWVLTPQLTEAPLSLEIPFSFAREAIQHFTLKSCECHQSSSFNFKQLSGFI